MRSSAFYSVLCGIGSLMAIHQLFCAACLVFSANETDFVNPLICATIYMLLLIFAGPISRAAAGTKPRLDPATFLCSFCTAVCVYVFTGKVRQIIQIARHDSLGLSDPCVYAGIAFYALIIYSVVFFFFRKIPKR
ncbi:MAG: hypothetical protein J5758_05860 [Abditibacteriota bacterium]|nr:hypothetical protein [Abditibacteriota bacterium]